MTTIVLRADKGSPLTHTEVDTNFDNLNTAKLETAAIPLGTLQAPSVSFLNDSDTGIFCPQGGNSLAIATGGQYAIACTSTQAVGIKTANPQKALHVAGPTRVGADDATDAFLEIGEGATGNRSSYIDIVADTTYTDYGLRIIRNNTGANATSELKHRGTGALNITTQEAASIVFNTTNSPALTILAGGNVGIGTSSPNQTLSVGSGAADTRMSINGTGQYQLQFTNSGANGFWIGSPGANSLAFAQNDGTTRMTIDSSGRVGIGTTDPAALLQPNGTVSITGGSGASSANGLHLYFDTATNSGNISAFHSGVDNRNLALDGKTIGFFIAGSDKARIDASGRLLVGTTSSTGLLSNTAPVIAGLFQSFNDTGDFTTGVAQTLFTIPNANATYIITLRRSAVGDATNYHAVSILSANATVGGSVSTVLTALKTAGNVSISISGTDLKGTQTSGGAASLQWVVTRVG